MRYERAVALQREVHEEVVGGGAMRVIVCEHEPVITVSQRKGAREHVVAGAGELERMGIEVCETDRGGDVTYHGPGQLVVYPIVRLNELGLNVGRYVRLLEEAVIGALGGWGTEGVRDERDRGVWVTAGTPSEGREERGERREEGSTAKICAIGVRVSRGVTMHGLALNVEPKMEHFGAIVPCGLVGRGVTSMKRVLGERCPGRGEVKRGVIAALEEMLRKTTQA
ncbi:MAG: lipoyl(octanoyl) transferase LipB [Phycisphaeraceae bacterium]|nr:lipoyl(octanoyl) transferase LipB [Phycisphaeraceae bacterium]